MISRDDLLDRVLWAAWSNVGGAPFRPIEAWNAHLPAEVRDGVIRARTYGHADPQRSAVQHVGRLLKHAADSGEVTARRLGVECAGRGRYRVVARGVVTQVVVADRAEALARIAALSSKVAGLQAELGVVVGELSALATALERDEVSGGPDPVAEKLSALARAHGDVWVPARTVRACCGAHFDVDALVDVPVDGLVLRRQRSEQTRWRVYRVELA